MSMNHNDWSILGKLIYKPFFRAKIQKFVKSTNNPYDDSLIDALDLFFG